MNILQITARDLVGGRFAGHLLHQLLREQGHEAEMLVLHKESREPTVHTFPAWTQWASRGFRLLERAAALQALLPPLAALFPLQPCFRRAEVLHLHLIYPAYVSLLALPALSRRRPTVWTLHDPWALTGHCVHPFECRRWQTGCGACPDLKAHFALWRDTTALLWRVKRALYQRSDLTLVVASRWMQERVEASPLLSRFPCRLIPFGLNTAVLRPRDRAACRSELGIAPGTRVIAFRSALPWDQWKGMPYLIEALRQLACPEPVCLLAFESRGRLTALADRYQIRELGWVQDEGQMARAYAAADVFVMPSLAESFGMMALEAMACGTPVVAFEGTALPDTVRAPEAGLVVPARDSRALADALAQLLGDDALRARMGQAGRRIVEQDYSHRQYVERHLELYAELLARRASG